MAMNQSPRLLARLEGGFITPDTLIEGDIHINQRRMLPVVIMQMSCFGWVDNHPGGWENVGRF